MPAAEKDLNRLRGVMETFGDWWTHFEVRSLVALKEDTWYNVATEVLLEHENIPLLSEPQAIVKLSSFRAVQVRRNIADFGELLSELEDGVLDLGDIKALTHDKKESKEAMLPLFFYHVVEGAGRNPFSPFGGFYLEGHVMSSRRILDDVFDGIANLDRELMAYVPPYNSLEQLSGEFLVSGERVRWETNSYLRLFAGVPVGLRAEETDLNDSRLVLGIVAPSLGLLRECGLGFRAYRAGKMFSSGAVLCSRKRWRQTREHPPCFVTKMPFRRCDHVELFLSLNGKALCTWSLQNSRLPEENVRIRLHAYLDPGFRRIARYLSGEGKDSSRNFERAVSWLLWVCGFTCTHYGSAGLTDEVDVVAVSTSLPVLIAVECTTDVPDTNQKISRLSSRCKKLNRDLGPGNWVVLPVVATALLSEDIPSADIMKAASEKVAILARDDTMALLDLAKSNAEVGDVLSFINARIPLG